MLINQVSNPFTTYISPKNRSYRVVSIEKIPNTTKWIKSQEKSLFKVLIKYLDNDTMLWLLFDYNDKLTETRKFE